MKIRKATKQHPRSKRFEGRLGNTAYIVRLEDEKVNRRVFEDWGRLQKNGSHKPSDWSPLPLCLIIKGVVVDIPEEQIVLWGLRD